MTFCAACGGPCRCKGSSGKTAKGAIWVTVRDDQGKALKGVEVLRDGSRKVTTDKDGVAKYDPLDKGGYEVALNGFSKQMTRDYERPQTDREQADVAEGAIIQIDFTLPRRINEVEATLTVDKAEGRPVFPDAAKTPEDIHHFKTAPQKKPDKPDVVAVTIGFTETQDYPRHDKGGKLSVSGVTAKFWQDAACKKELAAPGGTLTFAHGKLKAGVTVYASFEAAGEAEFKLMLEDTTKERVTLAKKSATAKVKVKPVNRVTPYVDVEHLVVLCERDLSKAQRTNDKIDGATPAAADLIHADATRIELRAAKTADSPAYTGKATLKLTPANAKAYEDEACTTEFDLSGTIDFAVLTAGKPKTLYLRGTTPGLFDLELELEDAADETIKVDGPAKGRMGAAELKLKLTHFAEADIDHDINPEVDDIKKYWKQLKALKFEQTEMTDAERIGAGRLLHAQKDKNHARAELELEFDKAQFPPAAKDYKVVLDAADGEKTAKKRSGGLKLFSAEEGGSEIALPLKLEPGAAKKKKSGWVEGAAICTGWRGIRLSLGFERPAGGPANKPRMDGDWAAFTVVRIKEVKCDFENEAGADKEKFIDGDKVFINLDANGRVLKTVGGSRKADVIAQVEPALEKLEIRFCIVEHPDTYKMTKLPKDFQNTKMGRLKETVKPKDRDDKLKLLHMKQETDDKGIAKIETLQAPQFGLMKFKIGAYLLQDPQHARYVDDHADLKKKAPVLSAKWLEVWRRLFFGVVAMNRKFGGSYLDRFDEARLKNAVKEIGIELERFKDAVTKPYETALVSFRDWSRSALGNPAPSRTMYLCLINGRGDKPDKELGARNFTMGGQATAEWDVGYQRFRSTTDRAKWLVSAELSHGGTTTDVAAQMSLEHREEFKFRLKADLTTQADTLRTDTLNDRLSQGDTPTDAQAAADAARSQFLQTARLKVKMKEADSSSGVSGEEVVVVCMDTREPEHATQNARDSASHTFMHEMGHFLSLAGKFLPDKADTTNPFFYSEQAGETSARGTGGMGLGGHCDGLNDRCIMWYQFKMTFEFCDTCKMHMRARAYNGQGKNSRAVF
jgi:hypothetical protein